MAEPTLTAHRLRDLANEHCGRDPGEIAPGARLADVGLTGFDLLRLVAAIEDLYAIEFPADLLSTFETVDDLVHFASVKASQAHDEGAVP